MNQPLDFQSIIMTLQRFWAEQGCLIWQPYYTQVGAGTYNPATFLRVLGPEPWNVAYVEPSVRPDDGRYGENPNRLQQHYQFQVILKPDPGQPAGALPAIAGGAGDRPAPARHPLCGRQLGIAGAGRLGAGLGSLAGWAGDHPVHLFPAGGRHRRSTRSRWRSPTGWSASPWRCSGVRNFRDLRWNRPDRTYGDVNLQGEQEHSKYYFEIADVDRLRQMYRSVRSGGRSCAGARAWCCRRMIMC